MNIKSVVRDQDYSTRTSRRGSLIKESHTVFQYLSLGNNLEDAKRKVLDGDIILDTAYHSRRSIWLCLYHRYFKYNTEWVIDDFITHSLLGERSIEFISLCYLHYCLHERVVFDFVREVVWNKWEDGIFYISSIDFLSFFESKKDEYLKISYFSENTKRGMADHILSSLRDFGVLEGSRKKFIKKPIIPHETVLHLLRILYSDGLRGYSIVQAEDWKLFLYSESEVVDILSQLSLEGKIGFEGLGRNIFVKVPQSWEE